MLQLIISVLYSQFQIFLDNLNILDTENVNVVKMSYFLDSKWEVPHSQTKHLKRNNSFLIIQTDISLGYFECLSTEWLNINHITVSNCNWILITQ